MTLPLEGIDEKICAEWAQTKRFKHTKSIFDIINSSSLSVVFVQHFLHWWASRWPNFCHPYRHPSCSLISYSLYSNLFHNISFSPFQLIILLLQFLTLIAPFFLNSFSLASIPYSQLTVKSDKLSGQYASSWLLTTCVLKSVDFIPLWIWSMDYDTQGWAIVRFRPIAKVIF